MCEGSGVAWALYPHWQHISDSRHITATKMTSFRVKVLFNMFINVHTGMQILYKMYICSWPEVFFSLPLPFRRSGYGHLSVIHLYSFFKRLKVKKQRRRAELCLSPAVTIKRQPRAHTSTHTHPCTLTHPPPHTHPHTHTNCICLSLFSRTGWGVWTVVGASLSEGAVSQGIGPPPSVYQTYQSSKSSGLDPWLTPLFLCFLVFTCTFLPTSP